ncbi:NAD binding Rossmann fold oxidoreductase [Penicillium verhagenii]|uniref:NAD binding Rossmann fold oxidoreductase n=1 Tax=Penicillium verhagenii TaxID=1562060 RepID=UPI0025452B60|nr:NAD binding Rossmann fold oxidoreductase [Penicillium verhagenii]KAJ5919355.1 NAD binding Rossmann fold oxidoreductase [Penicillium verhagenii]
MTSKTWKVGIVGYGLSAKVFHIPFINALPEFTLYAIVQRNPREGNDAAKDFPTVKCFRDQEDLFQDSMVDVVVISTPTDSHFPLVKSALLAQKHVVCEKPFTRTASEADELVALADAEQKLLTVFHNRRWDTDFVTLVELMNNGALGQVTEYETRFEFPHIKQAVQNLPIVTIANAQINAVYDLGTHLLDQAVQIFGFPQRVTGFIGDQTQEEGSSESNNIFTVLMHYENDVLVTAKAGRISPDEKPLRFSVGGDKGSFKKFYMDIQKEHIMVGKFPGDAGFGLEPVERYEILPAEKNDGSVYQEMIKTVQRPPTWAEYYRKLAYALSGQGAVPVSGAEARDIIRIIELALQSSKLGESLAFSR